MTDTTNFDTVLRSADVLSEVRAAGEFGISPRVLVGHVDGAADAELDADRRGARRLVGDRATDADLLRAEPVGRARRDARPEGGEPPADRVVQAARRAQQAPRAAPGAAGVVAGSAGNHGQSLAYAARTQQLPCEVFVPLGAAVSKVKAVRAFGAVAQHHGTSVDDGVSRARETAEERGHAFVHPFDDHAEQLVETLAAEGYLVAVPDLSLELS